MNEHFSQCKICDGIIPDFYGMAAPAAAPAPARAPTVRPMPRSAAHTPKEALELIELLTHFRSDNCSKFVYKWMELPRAVRKEYSYIGAIKCRMDSDPNHYFCPINIESYFDPSNWVYAVTMRLMMPKMMQEVEWSNETKGDIFESILGLNYLVANGLVVHYEGSLSKHIGTVSAIFDDFVWSTWRLCVAIGKTNTDRVVRWLTLIIDTVAYRQMKDDDIGNILLHESRTEFEFEPRCKRKGHLI